MAKERLETPRDYFDNITTVAYQQFLQSEVTFLVVYSMAAGLFHIAEWVHFHDQVRVKAKYGAQITSQAKLWHDVIELAIPEAGFIRDLNNAAKHVRLRFDPQKSGTGPSTNTHFAANTFIQTARGDGGGYCRESCRETRQVKMDHSGEEILLEPIANRCFQILGSADRRALSQHAAYHHD